MAGHNRRNDWDPWFRQKAGWHRDPKIVAANKTFGNKNPMVIYWFMLSLACERQWSCTNSGSYGRVPARDIMYEARGMRRVGAMLAELVLQGLLDYDADADEYLVVNWAKYNPMPGATAGQRQVHNDAPESNEDSDVQAPRTRVGERAPVRAPAPTPTRLTKTKTRTSLLEEQSREVPKELSRVAPPTPSPSPPGGGAAEPEPEPESLGRESEDQEQEPAPKLTQAQRNPRLAGVDGADEVIPDWRDLSTRQVAPPERVSTIIAGIRERLGQQVAQRRHQERENLSEEAFEARRRASLAALEAMDPNCKKQSPQIESEEIDW
jgi:hypothetical protein